MNLLGGKKVEEIPNTRDIEALKGVLNLREMGDNTGYVYFLVTGGQVVYIGSSLDHTVRVPKHLESKRWERTLWMEIPAPTIRWVETYLINYLKPPLNKNGTYSNPGGEEELNF